MNEEFWRDKNSDNMIEDIIDIFMKVEGVDTVILSGLTRRCRKVSGMDKLSPEAINGIVRKLKSSGIITYKFVAHCPICGEVYYQVAETDKNKPKFCSTCNAIYTLTPGTTLERED